MTTTTGIRTDLYVEVQQYYARQMRLLDSRDLAAYADTFTEDAVFAHSADREPARTRAGILQDLVEFHRRFETDPMRRRHHFTMLDVVFCDGDEIHTVFYALVVITRPGARSEIRASCVVTDVLVRENGELRNKSRIVEIDT
ncbi:nuclear transport factor 2 family protein [Actinokineospora iranica]|uniref:Actinorhodin biosynthesis protein ActVIA n=1 Tax=Actinokineospora iranica TaxID=1271860 RepID=A0A1G6S7G4_9PSEU|nr:nuclear transport factor 2 family protein [Actinokineospora iranica]SDD12067.1 actinorhodin biosynthesis protein ActVIA [Actinokineospora iranica]